MTAVEYHRDPAKGGQRRKYAFETLAVGDHLDVPAEAGAAASIRIGAAIHKFVRRYGGRFTQARVDDGTIRVTRAE